MFKLAPYNVDSPFADELQAFAQAEAEGAVPRHSVLFCGGSSIRMWTTLAADFPQFTVVNRGFGGSTLAELLAEMEWMIFPAQPKAIVLYAGDNDLDQGARPEEVLARFERFSAQVRDRLGSHVPLLFISIKPSPARLAKIGEISHANALVRAAIAQIPQRRFIDVFSAMLDSGKPRAALFDADGLHLSPAGYALWTRAVQAALGEPGLLP